MAESVASCEIQFSDVEIDFSNIIPKTLAFIQETIDVNSWQEVLKNLCFQLYKSFPERMIEKLKDPHFLWLDRRSDLFNKSILLNPFLFVEISKNEEECFNRCKQILLEFPEHIQDVSVFCSFKNKPEQYIQDSEDVINGLIKEWEKSTNGKIGQFARFSLTYILQNEILSETMLGELFTANGTQKQLGIRFMGLPLFSFSMIFDKNGYKRCWTQPVVVSNQKIYINFEWYEEDRAKFLTWIKKVLKEYLNGESSTKIVDSSCISSDGVNTTKVYLETPENQDEEDDTYGEILNQWGKDAL